MQLFGSATAPMVRSSRRGHFVICLLLAVIGKAALPEPPKQHDPWVRPVDAKIPEYVINVAATLFDAGLADPRGGAYREVQLPVQRSGGDLLKTHAWVFLDEYAVCWNGLVYRIHTAGAPADLDQDVRTIADAKPWSGRLAWVFKSEPNPASAGFWFDMELGQTIAPASIALLLRLNRPDLAARLWDAPESSDLLGNVGQHEGEEGLWLSTAASAWFGTAYRRLVGAFGNGDDRDAAEVADSILQWRSRVPAVWREPKPWVPTPIPDISFLDSVPALLADSQRRLREPARSLLDFKAISNGDADSADFLRTPQPDRIANLIDRMEDVRGDKIAIPGPLMFWGDPIYSLLVKEGEPAVDALLNAYEGDTRLTRTFDYSRPWSVAHTPVPVHDVVQLLLGDILADPGRVHNSTPAELRAWWKQYQSSGKALRSFAVLADDQAGPQRWVESAELLTMRSDVRLSEGTRTSERDGCDPKKPAPRVNGEALRSRQSPSVSDLLAKRAVTLVASGSELACRMAIAATLWDASAAVPALRAAAGLKSCRESNLFAVARLSVNEPGAAADWTAELRLRPASPPLRIDELSPLWMFPDNPVLRQSADLLFTRPESPLSPALRPDDVYSPLLVVPAFRQAAISALTDAKVVGQATRSAEGLLSYRVANGGGGGTMPGHDPRQAPAGQERPIRVKDLVASQLSNFDGAPKVEIDWPEPDKDAIAVEIAEFLKLHEKALRAFPSGLQDMSCPGESVFLDQ